MEHASGQFVTKKPYHSRNDGGSALRSLYTCVECIGVLVGRHTNRNTHPELYRAIPSYTGVDAGGRREIDHVGFEDRDVLRWPHPEIRRGTLVYESISRHFSRWRSFMASDRLK